MRGGPETGASLAWKRLNPKAREGASNWAFVLQGGGGGKWGVPVPRSGLNPPRTPLLSTPQAQAPQECSPSTVSAATASGERTGAAPSRLTTSLAGPLDPGPGRVEQGARAELQPNPSPGPAPSNCRREAEGEARPAVLSRGGTRSRVAPRARSLRAPVGSLRAPRSPSCSPEPPRAPSPPFMRPGPSLVPRTPS